MKVTDIRRKLAATLVAGGMLAPVASAADLDTNLVANPGFENVNINSSEGGYNAVEILDWTDGTETGFAYSHDGSLDGAGMTIPDYANGGIYTGGMAPAGTGSFYFTSNATPDDITGPGQVSQLIDVSTGDTGTLIGVGEAAISVEGFFSSFGGNTDFGTIQVDFLDAGASTIDSVLVNDSDTTTWTFESGGGLVPVGTETLQVSVFGTPISGGPDGYIDNVDVQISSAEDLLVFLEVDTVTGEASIRNNTGESIFIDYYEIFSDDGLGASLQPGDSDWASLQDQDLSGFPAGNGSGNGWEEADSSSSSVLAESYLTGNSELVDGANVSLGELFDTAAAQDLTFRYAAVAGSAVPLDGDYNGDGVVDAIDYAQWRDTLGDTVAAGEGADGNGDGTINTGDYDLWKANFGNEGGPIGVGVLTTGFVRYVTPSATAAGAPEPASAILVSLATVGIAGGWRRRT